MSDEERRKKADEAFEFHECPTCCYCITQLFMESVRMDYGCPRCKTPLAFFRPILRARPSEVEKEV